MRVVFATYNLLSGTLMYARAAVAILYRPYILNASASLPAGANTVWQKNATRRAREAASGTNNLLERLIELHAVEYLKPMMYGPPPDSF